MLSCCDDHTANIQQACTHAAADLQPDRGGGSHVGTLGLAVHKDVEADALLLVVGVLNVVIDDLLVLLLAELALLELQASPAQLCAASSLSQTISFSA